MPGTLGKARKSKRGGASAPEHCKRALGTCMTSTIRGGDTMRTAGRKCMSAFSACRGGRKASARKARKGKRR